MASVGALIGLGLPPRLAGIMGLTPTTKAGVGTAQATATPITSNFTIATTAVGQTAFRLGTFPGGAGPFMFVNTTATAALVFPPTGGTVQGGAANASFSVAQNKPVMFYTTGGGNWYANLSA